MPAYRGKTGQRALQGSSQAARGKETVRNRPESGRGRPKTVRKFPGGFESDSPAPEGRSWSRSVPGGLEGRRECYQTLGKRPESGQRPTPAPGRPAGTTGQEELQVGPLVYIHKPLDRSKFRKSTYIWAFEACLLSTVYLISSSIHM